jgi:hypothetical protein
MDYTKYIVIQITKMFRVEQVDHMLDFAEVVRSEDRERYRPIYNLIEEYAKENMLILGGESCIDLLKGEKRTNYHYEFYCRYSLGHANNLANYLDRTLSDINKNAKGKAEMFIVTMRTLIPKQSFSININARELVRVHEEKNYDTIIKQTIQVPTNKGILLMPPCVQLIDVYRALYHPINVDNWGELKEKESFLHNLVGDHDGFSKKYDVDLGLISDDTRVIVPINKPTIISSNPIVEDIKVMEKAYDVHLEYTTSDCSVLNDFRLTRYNIKKEGKDFIYVYNSMSYELIPVSSMVVFGQVALRILLVEAFMISVYVTREKIDSTHGKKLIGGLMNEYASHRKKMDFSLDPLPSDYRGVYISDQMYIKQLQSSSFMYDEYTPSEYFLINNEYRILGTEKK